MQEIIFTEEQKVVLSCKTIQSIELETAFPDHNVQATEDHFFNSNFYFNYSSHEKAFFLF